LYIRFKRGQQIVQAYLTGEGLPNLLRVTMLRGPPYAEGDGSTDVGRFALVKQANRILNFLSREWALAGQPLRKPAKLKCQLVETCITDGQSLLQVLTESLPPALGRALGEGAEAECRHLLGRYKVEKAKYGNGKVSLRPSGWCQSDLLLPSQ
jgi:hypothetical protein